MIAREPERERNPVECAKNPVGCEKKGDLQKPSVVVE